MGTHFKNFPQPMNLSTFWYKTRMFFRSIDPRPTNYTTMWTEHALLFLAGVQLIGALVSKLIGFFAGKRRPLAENSFNISLLQSLLLFSFTNSWGKLSVSWDMNQLGFYCSLIACFCNWLGYILPVFTGAGATTFPSLSHLLPNKSPFLNFTILFLTNMFGLLTLPAIALARGTFWRDVLGDWDNTFYNLAYALTVFIVLLSAYMHSRSPTISSEKKNR